MCTIEDCALLLVDCRIVGDDEGTSRVSCEVLCCTAASEESICNPATRDCASATG